MAMTLLPPDFKESLRLLNSKGVEYLIIGGYVSAIVTGGHLELFG
jgi:predicted nucleotidyltransferase